MEKTLEQLEQELVELKRQNTLMELTREQEKQKQSQDELAKKEKDKLKEEMREEIKKEYNLTATSRLPAQDTKQSMNLTSDKSFEEFKDGYIRRAKKRGMELKGISYAEMLENMSFGRSE
jgi:hypothetical protein